MRTRLRLLPLLAVALVGAVAVAGPAAADPVAATPTAGPTVATPTGSTPTTDPAPPTTGAPTPTPAPVPEPVPVPVPEPVTVVPEVVPPTAPVVAAPTTRAPRPTSTRPSTRTGTQVLPEQPATGGSPEATAATGLAATAATAAREGAQHAAEAEAGQLLVDGYVARANRAAAIDLSSPLDTVTAALDEARFLQQLVADQVEAVGASLVAAQDARDQAATARDQVLALPQTAAGVAEQTDYAQQVVAAAGISVDRAAVAVAAVEQATAAVQDAVATLAVRADRIDPASSSEPLPDAAAVYALGAVVVLGFGVTGTTAVSARRTVVRRRVTAVRGL